MPLGVKLRFRAEIFVFFRNFCFGRNKVDVKKFFAGVILFIPFVLFSCNPLQQAQKTALRKYGTDTLSAVNETHTFVLFQQASKSRSNPYAKTHFFVYDLKRNEVIYEDSIPSASVRWHTAQSLLISRQKGIIQDTEDDGKIRYIYDLNTKKTKEVSPNTQNEKI